ncbi:MAG: hypothetical protein WKF58_12660 [Ilumatobacteraceae bacterium]
MTVMVEVGRVEAFHGAQARRRCATVPDHLGIRRRTWDAAHEAHECDGTASARQARRAAAGAGRLAEALLHDAVLAGVVREHRHPPAGRGGRDGLVDGDGERGELVVDLDADRLEAALGRMSSVATCRGGDRGRDDAGELGGGGDRPGSDDGRCDPPGEALVAVLTQHLGQRALVVRVDDIVGGVRRACVHPHVERALVLVREATLGAVELR